jgi:pimeloyl-ACP methyl ester carboxylesterase
LLADAAGLRADAESASKTLAAPTVEALKDFQQRAYFRPRRLTDFEWQLAAERLARSPVSVLRQSQVADDFLDGKLASIHVPTVLLWGAADQIIPVTHGMLMARLIPGASWRLIPECGHLPQKECPEAVVQGLTDLVRFGAM